MEKEKEKEKISSKERDWYPFKRFDSHSIGRYHFMRAIQSCSKKYGSDVLQCIWIYLVRHVEISCLEFPHISLSNAREEIEISESSSCEICEMDSPLDPSLLHRLRHAYHVRNENLKSFSLRHVDRRSRSVLVLQVHKVRPLLDFRISRPLQKAGKRKKTEERISFSEDDVSLGHLPRGLYLIPSPIVEEMTRRYWIAIEEFDLWVQGGVEHERHWNAWNERERERETRK